MPWIVVLLRYFVIQIFTHVQPLCVGGQKDLACHRQCTKLSSPAWKNNNLMFAYDIQNVSNSAGGGGGVLPRENFEKYVLFGDFWRDVFMSCSESITFQQFLNVTSPLLSH